MIKKALANIIYIVTYDIKWVKTSWTHSILSNFSLSPKTAVELVTSFAKTLQPWLSFQHFSESALPSRSSVIGQPARQLATWLVGGTPYLILRSFTGGDEMLFRAVSTLIGPRLADLPNFAAFWASHEFLLDILKWNFLRKTVLS